MILSSFSFLPEPIAWETSTCPAFEKPRQAMMARFTTRLASETADRPAVPTYFPTIIMSMVEYSTKSALDAINGSVNNSSRFGMLPIVKSFVTELILIHP